jgi:hypothetical protein
VPLDTNASQYGKPSLQKAFRHGHGFEHRFGLIDCFLEFFLGRGVVDPATNPLTLAGLADNNAHADDDLLFELAVAGNASYIVTHNLRDFREMEKWGIRAASPSNFLKQVEKKV